MRVALLVCTAMYLKKMYLKIIFFFSFYGLEFNFEQFILHVLCVKVC